MFEAFVTWSAVTVVGSMVAAAAMVFAWFIKGKMVPVPVLGVVSGRQVPAQPAKKTAGWQVRFAGEWHECNPPLGENSPGWVRVQLTDRRTHSRIIVRPADEIQRA